MLTLGRSWIARGNDAASFDDAMEDYRRVVRLGRLLRQDDALVIQDLIGLACIRMGVEAIHDRVRREGNSELAHLAAVVASESAPQRLRSAERMAALEVGPYLRGGLWGLGRLELPDLRFKVLGHAAASSPDRRFRVEAILNLRVVAALGSRSMRASARELLEKLITDRDPIVGANARWSLATPVKSEELAWARGRNR